MLVHKCDCLIASLVSLSKKSIQGMLEQCVRNNESGVNLVQKCASCMVASISYMHPSQNCHKSLYTWKSPQKGLMRDIQLKFTAIF